MDIKIDYYNKLKQKIIDNAPSEEEYFKFTKKEKDDYQLSLKIDRDLINSYETSYKIGYQKGVKLGIAENLLDVLDNEMIAFKTGLAIEEIEKLR